MCGEPCARGGNNRFAAINEFGNAGCSASACDARSVSVIGPMCRHIHAVCFDMVHDILEILDISRAHFVSHRVSEKVMYGE